MASAPAPSMTSAMASAAQAPPGTTRTLSGAWVDGRRRRGGGMEVLSSSGSRPSTSESDASARGSRPAHAKAAKDVARVQKLDKLSAMYGGADGAHATHGW